MPGGGQQEQIDFDYDNFIKVWPIIVCTLVDCLIGRRADRKGITHILDHNPTGLPIPLEGDGLQFRGIFFPEVNLIFTVLLLRIMQSLIILSIPSYLDE